MPKNSKNRANNRTFPIIKCHFYVTAFYPPQSRTASGFQPFASENCMLCYFRLLVTLAQDGILSTSADSRQQGEKQLARTVNATALYKILNDFSEKVTTFSLIC